jgi:hypothetical protein
MSYIKRPKGQPGLALMDEIYCRTDKTNMANQIQNRSTIMIKEFSAYLLQA